MKPLHRSFIFIFSKTAGAIILKMHFSIAYDARGLPGTNEIVCGFFFAKLQLQAIVIYGQLIENQKRSLFRQFSSDFDVQNTKVYCLEVEESTSAVKSKAKLMV